MRMNAGWSLLELLYILLIIFILLSIATPSLERFVLDARQTTDINAFVSAVQLARSEAAKQSRVTVLCATADWTRCAASTAYERGWMVFVSANDADPDGLDGDRSPIFAYAPVMSGAIRSNRQRFIFRPFYKRSTNGTVTFCDRRGKSAARVVVLSYTGRPRVTEPETDHGSSCAS